MNPRAEIIDAVYAKVDPEKITDTGIFDIGIAEQSSLWVAELEKEESSESDEYGIETFVYTTIEKFNERKLIDKLQEGLPDNIFRSKGLIAIEGSDGLISGARPGNSSVLNRLGGLRVLLKQKPRLYL